MSIKSDSHDLEIGYLQHGQAPGPMRTERVNVRLCGWPHTGMWEAFYMGRWRRVFVQIKRTFITYRGTRITIKIEGV